MRRSGGFTLIEVLVSLFILSVGVLALMHFQGVLFQGTTRASDYAGASNLAQNALEERRACAPVLCNSSDFAPPRPAASAPLDRYQCKLGVKTGQDEISVRWQDSDGRDNELTLSAPSTGCGGG